MNHSNSGLAHGTSGSPQLTLENGEMSIKSKENEANITSKYKYDYNMEKKLKSKESCLTMDIRMLFDNTEFYGSFEDEHEIELFISENPELNIRIWEGYFSDIFGEPSFNEKGLYGFTRDFQQCERTFEEKDVVIDIDEYLTDLLNYKDKKFKFEETRKCYELLRIFLEYAQTNSKIVRVNWW